MVEKVISVSNSYVNLRLVISLEETALPFAPSDSA